MGGIGAAVELGPDAAGPLADEVTAGLVDAADDEVAGEVEAGSAAADAAHSSDHPHQGDQGSEQGGQPPR